LGQFSLRLEKLELSSFYLVIPMNYWIFAELVFSDPHHHLLVAAIQYNLENTAPNEDTPINRPKAPPT
jgi:hypothetical protein